MKKIISTACCLALAILAQAQSPSFTPGNLAVLRWGDGTQSLVASGNSVFIDQFVAGSTNASPVNSVAIPSDGTAALILDGTAISEGGLTRSMDGTMLSFAGYNTNLNSGAAVAAGALGNTAATVIPRNLATLDAFGAYDQVQTITGYYSTQSPRFAVTDGANNFWVAAGINGIVYFNPPSSSQPISTSLINNRAIRIFGGNLYFSTQKASPTSNNGIYTFTTTPGAYTPAGLVTTPSVGTNLVFATGSSSAISDFALNADSTIAYVADTVLGVQKWVNGAGTWNLVYTFALAPASQPPGAFGVAVDFSGPDPIIYATTTETNSTSKKSVGGNHLVRIVDTNAAAAIVYLAQANTNQAFKGLDFVPDLRPQVIDQPQGQMVTNGTPNVSIEVAATSPFSLNYQWQLNGTNVSDSSNITGSTTPSLNFQTCVTSNQGAYTVVITNQYSAITSAVAVLTVSLTPIPPSIVAQPVNKTNFIGANVSFSVTASGTGPLAYQWSQIVNNVTNNLSDGPGLDGEAFSGSTSNIVVVANAQTNDAGNYIVNVSNMAGATNSRVVTLTLLPVPPRISAQPAPLTTAVGSIASFQVVATGTSLAYQWKYNSTPLSDGAGAFGEVFSGSTSPNLRIANVQTNDIGNYSVTITNSVGSTNSQSVLLNAIILPPPSYIPYSSAGSVYTQDFDSLPGPGTNYTVTVAAGNPVVINGTNYSFGNANPFDFAAPILPTGSPGGLGLANAMPGWYGWVQGGPGFNRFGANAGDYTTGGIQSFGSTNSYAASKDRALGLLTTAESLQSAIAARFINNTPNALSKITLQFTGELWRQSTVPKSLVFHYVMDARGTNAFDVSPADFVYLTNLDVSFPTNPAASGGVPVDGNLAANQITNSIVNQVITNWPPGGALWLVWQYTNSTGKAQGVSIDNLSFSARPDNGAPGAPATLSVLTRSSLDGSVSFNISGQAGYGYIVQTTTNLAYPDSWRSLATNILGVSSWVYTDTSPGNNPLRFYRVKSQ
jgi:hypothetical protein